MGRGKSEEPASGAESTRGRLCFLDIAVGDLQAQAAEDERFAGVERFLAEYGESLGVGATRICDFVDDEQHELFAEMYASHPAGSSVHPLLQPGQRPTTRFEHVKRFRIGIEVYEELVPKTAQNFVALCTGEKGIGKVAKKPLHYKNVPFHRVEHALMQGGDITRFDGSGGESIYGKPFIDEKSHMRHDRAGIVSMANSGSKNSNSSQFFILFGPLRQLDAGKTHHTIFGCVIDEDLPKLESIRQLAASASGMPTQPVTILDCGLLKLCSIFDRNVFSSFLLIEPGDGPRGLMGGLAALCNGESETSSLPERDFGFTAASSTCRLPVPLLLAAARGDKGAAELPAPAAEDTAAAWLHAGDKAPSDAGRFGRTRFLGFSCCRRDGGICSNSASLIRLLVLALFSRLSASKLPCPPRTKLERCSSFEGRPDSSSTSLGSPEQFVTNSEPDWRVLSLSGLRDGTSVMTGERVAAAMVSGVGAVLLETNGPELGTTPSAEVCAVAS
ncbi:Peptidyl-prolyl cis-trans isomerase [Porphyridium purpureum]|uniref:Peptidyl-prolyl cis-trans isomerase n=1 Tax=Porphyridium purpureum TaxID=35688 RepID=A0A5J4YND6_PORPP|nr:Peptidyl-prolyl cis-trans isomerase [Porphyridium purpureum]|eukprot:POR0275..scf222_8